MFLASDSPLSLFHSLDDNIHRAFSLIGDFNRILLMKTKSSFSVPDRVSFEWKSKTM